MQGEGPVGLTTTEAKQRLAEYGPNELEAADKDTFLKILLTQMSNFIFLLTTTASIICYATGDQVKGTFLICLVVVVCFINAVGEYSGQDAGAALQAMSADAAKVWRDGAVTSIPVHEIVPGDIVELGTGTMVPADMEVLKCVDLQTNESCLTGEPKEVNKVSKSDAGDPKESDGDGESYPPYMCFKNTEVVAGVGKAQVTATGMSTKVGLIAKRLKNPEMIEGHGEANSVTKQLNPLQRSINQLGTMILLCCVSIIIVGALASYFLSYQNLPPKCSLEDRGCFAYESLLRGLLMAIAIIPHGLPLVVMVMLRVGSQLMLERNAMVMRQSAVDYLGATHVICTDKTGTLTAGVMAAKVLIGMYKSDRSTSDLAEANFYPLKGLNPEGGIFLPEQLTKDVEKRLDAGVQPDALGGDVVNLGNPQVTCSGANLPTALVTRTSLAAAFINCHSCKIVVPTEEHGKWKTSGGNTTDSALKVAAWKGGLVDDKPSGVDMKAMHSLEESLEIPFSSSRKMSATVHKLQPGAPSIDQKLVFDPKYTHVAIVKGAPDRVMPKLSYLLQVKGGKLSIADQKITADERKRLEDQNGTLARQALRSILMAVRPLTASDIASLQKAKGQAEARLNLLLAPGPLALLSLWGIFDPPRSTVPPSVKMAHEAGIRVVMITGDQRPTALAIGKLVGILPNNCDPLMARPCADMHLKDDRIIKQISQYSHKGERPDDRKLTVHDVKTQRDAHEDEYVGTSELAEMTSSVCVWSRAQPTDKVAIVDSLDWQELIVAMTGDGVNDAPALKRADIGVAMGIAGTPVTKNAADMVLQDDNFSTIVAAVAEGRKIYGNVQKYVIFNLCVKGAECAACMVAIFFGLPLPISGLPQLVNLVSTHIIPPMALAWEDAEDYTMKIKPRDTKRDLVVNKVLMLFRWLPFIVAYVIFIVTSMVFYLWMETGFFRVRGLIGTPVASMASVKRHACQVAGHIDEYGRYHTDAAPFHCVCHVRKTYWDSSPDFVDQWGRFDANDVEIDKWTGDAGTFFDLDSTPWTGDGFNKYIKFCKTSDGGNKLCWKDPEAPRPLLDQDKNCAAWGSRIATTMSYVSVQVGEILSLVTFRTDGFFGFARFSRGYAGMLAFNLCVLFFVVYVPFATDLLELAPLTYNRFLIALLAPALLVMSCEIIKIEYRSRLAQKQMLEAGNPEKAPLL